MSDGRARSAEAIRLSWREQRVAARPADVVGAVVVELRVVLQLEVVVPAVLGLEADPDQDDRALGVGRVGADEAPAGGLGGLRVGQRVVADRSAGDALPVDHEGQVAGGGMAEVRVVDLGHVGVAEREPDAALAARGGAEALLVRAAQFAFPPGAPGARSRACAGARERQRRDQPDHDPPDHCGESNRARPPRVARICPCSRAIARACPARRRGRARARRSGRAVLACVRRWAITSAVRPSSTRCGRGLQRAGARAAGLGAGLVEDRDRRVVQRQAARARPAAPAPP